MYKFLVASASSEGGEGVSSEGRCDGRQFIYYYRDETKLVLQVPRQCPLVLMVRV
jgi:hypothetical protein